MEYQEKPVSKLDPGAPRDPLATRKAATANTPSWIIWLALGAAVLFVSIMVLMFAAGGEDTVQQGTESPDSTVASEAEQGAVDTQSGD